MINELPEFLQVRNFAVQAEHLEYKDFVNEKEIHLSRYKFLEKFVKWIHRKCGVYYMNTQTRYYRIEINKSLVREQLYSIANAYILKTGKRPTHIIIGFDKMCDLIRQEVHTQVVLDTKEFCGFILVLNPFINGIVPVAL